MKYLPSSLRPPYHFLAYNLFQRHRLNRTVMTSVHGIDLVIEPTVMHPRVFKSGKIFAEYIMECDLRAKAVLDMGTGSGILAIACAKRGAQVLAADLNPHAVTCARANVDRNRRTSSVTLIESDLFQALGSRKFDVIMFNPPYLADAPGGPYESAMHGGAGLDVLKRFAAQAAGHLNGDGVLLLIFSTDSPLEQLFSIFSNNGYVAEVLRRRSGLFEEFLVCQFTPLDTPEVTVEMRDRTLICPSCSQRLIPESNGWRCDRELLRFGSTNGIPDFVLESRRPDVERFLRTYQAVRRKEGWGSMDRKYYLSLPETDTTGRHRGIWKIRSQSYRTLIGDLGHSVQPGAKVLDLGSGNGWLSNRLARAGYEVIAADVNLDAEDGLLAPTALSDNGKQLFVRVRAEFDRLPFPDRSFDAIVFNASIHYSWDPIRSMRDTIRLLSEHGVLYILDSPWYDDPNDGMAMLREKTLDVELKTGWRLSEDDRGTFLGPDLFRGLTAECSVHTIDPHSRVRRLLRGAIARFLRQHAPASFPIVKIQICPVPAAHATLMFSER